MFKFLTVKSLVVLFVLGFFSASAQTIWTEAFSDQASSTANWTSGGSNAGATPQNWTWTNDPGAGFQTNPPQVPAFGSPTVADGYFFFNSDANGAGAHDVTLTGYGNAANCTGYNDVRLRFYTQYARAAATTQAQVGISTDGINFTYKTVLADVPVNSIAAGQLEIPLPEANNQAFVFIQFRWVGDYDYHWKIDDVELFNVLPVESPVTFKVNMANSTVAADGVRIAGSFNNWSDDLMTDEGNGVWSITKNLVEGQKYSYKFKNGASGWESGNPACFEDDGSGNLNRTYTVAVGGATLAAVCFNACGPCVVTCSSNPDAIICDDFESYNVGLVSPQATWWTPWSLNDNDAAAGRVSTEFASNGTKSMRIKKDDDQLLTLGNKSTGRYSLKWKMYVQTGKGAYFNIQTDQAAPGATNANFSGQTYFWKDGTIFNDNPAPNRFGTYPHDTWFTVETVFDLDNNIAKMYVGGDLFRAWAYTQTLGAIDFYSPGDTTVFFVDQVEYVKLPAVSYNVDVCDAAVDLTPYFGAAPGVAQTTGIYNNTTATGAASDPTAGNACWGEQTIEASMWYTFPGDGKRYHIETVPCTTTPANYIGGTDPNRIGDTQMSIYSGNDCTALTPVACNDDVYSDGMPDWRSGIDIETVAGTNYYMMIDAYKFQNVTARGEFCVQITQESAVTCAQGAVGTYALGNDGYVCFGGNINTLLDPNEASFVIPEVGPIYGMVWTLTQNPVPAGAWPGTISGIASTIFNPNVLVVNVPNDGTANSPAPGIYYLTPVVVGGGTLIDATLPARIFNVDVANGCYFVGESKQFVIMPNPADYDALGGTITAVSGPNGTVLTANAMGGFPAYASDPTLYTYLWSNGATTQSITVTTGGNFTVTISDVSGCDTAVPVAITGATDPSSVKSLSVSPNPTNGNVTLAMSLETVSEVRANVVNALGQTLQTLDFGRVSSLNQNINMGAYSDGVYFLRLSVDGQMTERRIVVSH